MKSIEQKQIANFFTTTEIVICNLGALFAIFTCILHSRESEMYCYVLDGMSALAWELPFPKCLGHLSST